MFTFTFVCSLQKYLVPATQPTNNSTGNSGRRLNPTAQVFVPRSMMPSPSPSFNGPPQPPANVGVPANNHHHHSMPNGNVNNIQSSSLLDGDNDIEDYIALSYLKEFISSISNKPSIYELGINEITAIVNSYLDEDECVLELIVNQIVDQVLFSGIYFSVLFANSTNLVNHWCQLSLQWCSAVLSFHGKH